MAEPEIAQAVIAGDGRSGLTALLVPAQGYEEGQVAEAVRRVNQRLSVTERIRRHAVVGAVHRGEWLADSDPKNPAASGDTGERGGAGAHARIVGSDAIRYIPSARR